MGRNIWKNLLLAFCKVGLAKVSLESCLSNGGKARGSLHTWLTIFYGGIILDSKVPQLS
jgi:hypothetical protein